MPWQTDPHLWRRLKPHARAMRSDPTPAEAILWEMLRGKQLGVKFRRQHTVGPYILDFYSSEAKLCIELDGLGHGSSEQRVKDRSRDRFLEGQGIQVLRFWNADLLERSERVLERILDALARRTRRD